MGALSIRVSQSRAERGAAVMGVLNATPDSFYDGGRYLGAESARARVDALIEAGADIIDIGGESSRPGAPKVSAEEQIERIDAALSHAVARSQLVSVDTTEPAVADYALSRGAACVNDVSCLADSELARVCARHSATLIVMHARGAMQHMAGFSEYPDDAYGDVVEDVLLEWRAARDRALREGLSRESIWLDPGIGFAKNARQSFELPEGELGALALRELGKALRLPAPPSPAFLRVVKWREMLPQYLVGHAGRIDAAVAELARNRPRIVLAGNYLTGVSIPKCLASGRAAADRVLRSRDVVAEGTSS